MNANEFDTNLARILDLNDDISELIEETLNYWSYDLQSRRPGPAYTNRDGTRVFTGQEDLELACFLSALIDRRARIKFPRYKGRTGTSKTEGTVRTGAPQGRILAMIANKTKPSFSIRVEDQSVTVSGDVSSSGFDEPGIRTYMLQDYDGNWAPTWHKIEFLPSEDENAFLNNNDLWDGHTVRFSHFIHPNRWTGVYGRYYVITKVLLERCSKEYTWTNSESKRIQEAGISLPDSEKRSWPKSTKSGEEVSIRVPTIEAHIEHPEFSGEFDSYETTVEGLRSAEERKRYLRKVKERLQFHTRATEFAFLKYGHEDGEIRYPSWISDRFSDHKIKRTVWQRLNFSTLNTTDSEGVEQEEDIALLYRKRKVSVRVAKSSITDKDEVTESRTSV